MVKMNESRNFNAQSTDNQGNIIMTMTASVTDGESVFFGKSIPDLILYSKNKEIADLDYAEFENSVLSKIVGI